MRSRKTRQLTLFSVDLRHEIGKEPKAISEILDDTPEIYDLILDDLTQSRKDTGRKVRIDSTAIETDIHDPSDSTLLNDGIRIITRWLNEGHALKPAPGIHSATTPESRRSA